MWQTRMEYNSPCQDSLLSHYIPECRTHKVPQNEFNEKETKRPK